jgi:DNA-binding CsgD family transcriptional regulator
MRLTQDTVARTAHMLQACRLDSASIFFCDRSDSQQRLSYLYHAGVSEEAQHVYESEGIFESDPFTCSITGDDRIGRFMRWEDERLARVADKAPDYRSFISQYSVAVVGAYLQQVIPGLVLVLGAHCRTAGRKSNVPQRLLEQELAGVAQMVTTQLIHDLLASPALRPSVYRLLHETNDNELCPWARLSSREREIADLVCLGHQNKQIAFAVGLSEFTVENHLRHIYHKLGVRNRASMVAQLVGSRSIQ